MKVGCDARSSRLSYFELSLFVYFYDLRFAGTRALVLYFCSAQARPSTPAPSLPGFPTPESP